MTNELKPLTPAEGLQLYFDDMQSEYAEATLYSKNHASYTWFDGAKKRRASTTSRISPGGRFNDIESGGETKGISTTFR